MNLVENITSVIPQREPFVMVDKLIYADETLARTVFQIGEENVLVEDGKFSEAGMVENMAQTAAAHAGYFATQNKETVKTGYIGAVKKLQIFSLPDIDESLITEIKIVNQVFNVSMIEAKVYCADKLVASCEMKIFLEEQSLV